VAHVLKVDDTRLPGDRREDLGDSLDERGDDVRREVGRVSADGQPAPLELMRRVAASPLVRRTDTARPSAIPQARLS
jgi:hypothetical protein